MLTPGSPDGHGEMVLFSGTSCAKLHIKYAGANQNRPGSLVCMAIWGSVFVCEMEELREFQYGLFDEIPAERVIVPALLKMRA